jgi:serine phosphatase RsbU (regulator of sigma subunit)
MAIAEQGQVRLFPQRRPQMRTLVYAGTCHPARTVGGDYYDFLDLGSRRLGLVLADIAGKGIGAALLMANLQAALRSQCATAREQPERFLRSVNQLLYENAERDYKGSGRRSGDAQSDALLAGATHTLRAPARWRASQQCGGSSKDRPEPLR